MHDGDANARDRRVLSLHWGYSSGGVGKYGVLLDKAASAARVNVDHCCIRGANWHVDEATLASLGAKEIIIGSRVDFSWVRRLADLLRTNDYRVVMTHGFNGHIVMQLMRLLKRYDGALVCSYHGQYHPTTRSRMMLAPFYNRFTERYIRKTAAATIAVATYTRDYLVDRGVDAGKITVVHNGIGDVKVDEARVAALRREWGVDENDIVIGVASRLDPVKGIEYLVEAFSELAKRFPNVRLIVVGTGTLDAALQVQAESLGVRDKVVFTGFRGDVADCLAAFDIFALPSLAEYHSIALLEAMRAGRAIVATNVGGNTESVRHAREALVVSPADGKALYGALSRLVANPATREELGANARRRYQTCFRETEMLEKTGEWLASCGAIASDR